MSRKWMQDTGIADSLTPVGPQNGTVVKAGVAGIVLLWETFKMSLSSVLPWAVLMLWLSWMVLGVARAMHRREEFCASKAMGGAWRLVGVVALWITCLTCEAILKEQGQNVPLAAVALSWVAVTFFFRSIDAASYFFPGLRQVLEKVAPSMFPKDVPPDIPPAEDVA